MLRRLLTRLVCWYRRDRNYSLARHRSGTRAVTMAESLIGTGVLQSSRMTGNPLVRET